MLALVSFYGCREQDEINHQMVKNDTFFEYSGSNESVAGIVSMMEQKNDSSEYVSTYSKEYGVPLWDESVWLPYDGCSLTVVPIIEKENQEFQTIWVFRQKGHVVDYFTYSKKNELGKYSAYYWMFDYFTQKIFHKESTNDSKILDENLNDTRFGFVEYCKVVATGYIHENNFVEVDRREECWFEIIESTTVFEDAPRGGGGGGGSGISPAPDGTNTTSPLEKAMNSTFNNLDKLKLADRQKVDTMYKKIAADCAGQTLLFFLSKLAPDSRLNIEFTDSIDKYSSPNNTIYIRNQGESNEFFHELFHAYQSSFLTNIEFNSRVLNLEIEAHLAQYKFMGRSKESRKKWTGNYKNNLRLRGIVRLNDFVDDYGKAIEEITETEETAIKRAESAVAESYRMFSIHEKYGTFKGVYNFTLAFNFSNLRNLTKNC